MFAGGAQADADLQANKARRGLVGAVIKPFVEPPEAARRAAGHIGLMGDHTEQIRSQTRQDIHRADQLLEPATECQQYLPGQSGAGFALQIVQVVDAHQQQTGGAAA